MLMSGAVKIQSECPTWLGLTALDYHFDTQPLPTPLAWWASTHVPREVKRFGVAATLVMTALGHECAGGGPLLFASVFGLRIIPALVRRLQQASPKSD